MRIVRRLLITVLILGALFAGLNIWGERIAEDRIAVAIRDRFGLEQTPEVNLDVFPIVTTLIRGSLPGLEVRASDVRVEELRIAELTVALTGVAIDGGLLGGGGLAVTVDEGRVEATIRQGAINRLLRERGEDARVTLREGSVRARATRTFAGSPHEIDATGRLRLVRDGRRLRFVPERVLVDGEVPPPVLRDAAEDEARFEVRIPELPGDFRPDRLETGDRFVRIAAVLSNERVELR